jgi:transposase
VSFVIVVLPHVINSNLVGKWIPLYRDQQPPELPAFLPLKLEAKRHAKPERFVLIEVGERSVVVVKWSVSYPKGRARFVLELAW